MNKDVLIERLTKYKNFIKDRMESPIPEKHLNRKQAFLQFLSRELEGVTAKIESIKLEGTGK